MPLDSESTDDAEIVTGAEHLAQHTLVLRSSALLGNKACS